MYEIINLDELIRRLEKYSHKELHVHHTWRPNHAQYYGTNHKDEDKRAIDRQKAMRDFHVNTNGWSDIGQHVTLLPDGRFVTGRKFSLNPASISGYNSGAFAVEMIGDFDKGKDKLEGWQRESIIGLARWFDSRGKYIRFHRENSSKTCPGSGIDKAEFMNEVRGIKKGDDKVSIKVGDKVKVIGSKYANGVSIPAFVKNTTHVVSQIKGSQILLGANGGINSWVMAKDVQVVSSKPAPAPVNNEKIKQLEAELKEYQDFIKQLKKLLNKA